MSNKTDVGGNVPKLRFPEFRDAPEWEEKTLGGIASFNKGKGISKADVEQNGNTPCIRYGELYTKYTEVISVVESRTNLPVDELFLSKKNDVLIPSSGETKLDIASASCVELDGVALGGDINVLRSKQNGIFLSYYLNAKKKYQIAKIAQGDTVVHLYPSQLKGIEVETPKPAEQQKIAGCLSSIDKLIAAQTQKLDALNAHKRGLMQQLFPAEGETVPELRFPDFRDEGEWSVRQLGEFITERSRTPKEKLPLFSLTIENGITPKTERYERSFLVKNEEEAYKLVLPEDFAYNPMNLRFGAIAMHSGTEKVALSKYYGIFYCDKTVDCKFCEIYFKSQRMLKFFDDMAIGSLIEKRRVHFNNFLKFEIRFPLLSEQQKIAGCLTSMEDLVSAQTQKIEALKAHKKGLMQQLFPSADEAHG